MDERRSVSFVALCALPFIAVALAAARPLRELPGHAAIGWAVCAVGAALAWRLARGAIPRHGGATPTLALAGALLTSPWLLIALLWTGLGAPFQADASENQDRYLLLVVDALLVGGGFVMLSEALRERGAARWAGGLLAVAIPASLLYVSCVALTLAQAAMAVQGDRTPVPPIVGHLYDTLEFFACLLAYLGTALAAAGMHRVGWLGRNAMRVFVALCLLILGLLALRGVEFPEISGRTAPWYTQPGVIVRIPAMPWLMPGVLAAWLLRAAGRAGSSSSTGRRSPAD